MLTVARPRASIVGLTVEVEPVADWVVVELVPDCVPVVLAVLPVTDGFTEVELLALGLVEPMVPVAEAVRPLFVVVVVASSGVQS
jgi:hypothetical protein